jgi:hypothetical protein
VLSFEGKQKSKSRRKHEDEEETSVAPESDEEDEESEDPGAVDDFEIQAAWEQLLKYLLSMDNRCKDVNFDEDWPPKCHPLVTSNSLHLGINHMTSHNV